MSMRMNAQFSDDRTHRYRLERIWDERTQRYFVVIGLNPSTADEKSDDPTIRRCINFAKREGFGRLMMLNLFSYRATDPRAMRLYYKSVNYFDPSHHTNRQMILQSIDPKKDRVVAAWGTNGDFCGQADQMRQLLEAQSIRLYTFGELTKNGHPKHPLYLPSSTPLVEWPYDHR